jgi:methionyl aminopeptidase
MAKRKSRIQLRSGAELDGLREAGSIAADILRQCSEMVCPEITTGEIDAAADQFIKDRGCVSAFLGYRGFPGNICISMNEEVVHGIGGELSMKEGDIVKIDVGIQTPEGWIGDNAKTIAVGKIDDEVEQLLIKTEESLHQAISHAREGEYLSTLCASVEEYVATFGFTVVKQFVGHGVGRKLHEEPQVPNYWDANEMKMRRFANPRLKEGMVLAIEPMVNAGGDEVLILSDDWTVITADRKMSSHFEHTVLVTSGEPEILTPRPRSYESGVAGAASAA